MKTKMSEIEIKDLMRICRQTLERQKCLRVLFCSSLLLLSENMVQAQTDIFKSPCDEARNPVTNTTQRNVPHRIPAIVEAAHGEILVFADKRWGYGDIGQHNLSSSFSCNGATSSQIDIEFRRSTDLGATWDLTKKEFVSRATSGSDASGDVAVVANRENRDEILVITAGGDVFFTQSKNQAGRRLQIRRYYSKDGGATWGNGYIDLTDAIYATVGYDGMFFSSGRILQSTQKVSGKKYCRLYAALATTNSEGTWLSYSDVARSVLLCSDDFGLTWQSCGIAVAGGDEAKVEELPNGNIVVSAKYKNGTRKFNIYDPKTETWLSDGGVEYTFNSSSATNGELLIVPVNNGGVLEHYVLQSIPTGVDKRSDVKIYYKKLSESDCTNVTAFATSGWCSTADAYMLAEGTAAYSTMIVQSDGKIGAAYEQDAYACGGSTSFFHIGSSCTHATGYDIMYNRISIADIIGVEGAEIITDENLLNKKMNVCSHEAHAQVSSGYSWASLCLPFTVSVPEGVTAYKVVGISEDNSFIDIEAIGNVIPAGEAVVLRDEMKRTEIKLLLSAHAAASADNLLQGCYVENIKITDDNYVFYYVLSHGSQCEAFYLPPNGYLKAHLAYLCYEQPRAASLMLRVVNGETTEIKGVGIDVLRDEVPVYDLGGRRVQDATQPGVYIRSGKKYIVR